MKAVQIGLGSMGKRRIRNLLSVGINDITGFDKREDRRREAEDKYQIKTSAELTADLLSESDILIVSTPPDRHLEYLRLAVEHGKPAFVEASVIRDGLEEVSERAKEANVLIAPSCTFRFHPGVKTIKDIVLSGKYGKLCNFIYIMGQYLPDWHPWENIKDFYVSKRETSASREMVPFELTWLLDITGRPEEVFAFYGSTHNMGVDIDDTYNVNFKFKDFLGTLIVDVVSRFATRSLVMNLEKAQIRWNWEERRIRLYEAENKSWKHFDEPAGKAESEYNKNIIEEMYVDEMSAFVDSAKGIKPFPNTLDEDIGILTILEKAEQTNKGVSLNGELGNRETEKG
ncbi:MAG TPA: Gfo/Idh/MocA family oxidoreductase [Nitrospirae bacterium]|nr:putative oxidoreductase [bacterium BMS3Abin06]HDH11415.1 Gfo/Idh/MocA family oxidoreductase [Nitrospirota bacterium]HDZ01431.1 Gfo/Idh/MocA family oxidoreductase [Nitrospirota bacterium]